MLEKNNSIRELFYSGSRDSVANSILLPYAFLPLARTMYRCLSTEPAEPLAPLDVVSPESVPYPVYRLYVAERGIFPASLAKGFLSFVQAGGLSRRVFWLRALLCERVGD